MPNSHAESGQSSHGEQLQGDGELDRPGEREVERNPTLDLAPQHISCEAVTLQTAADIEQAAHELERPGQAGQQFHAGERPVGHARAAELLDFRRRDSIRLKLRRGKDSDVDG